MIFWHLLHCNFNTRSYGAIITGVRPLTYCMNKDNREEEGGRQRGKIRKVIYMQVYVKGALSELASTRSTTRLSRLLRISSSECNMGCVWPDGKLYYECLPWESLSLQAVAHPRKSFCRKALYRPKATGCNESDTPGDDNVIPDLVYSTRQLKVEWIPSG